jgi:hypothetical protein
MDIIQPARFPVYFKQVWTANTHIIPVNPELTVIEFIEVIKPLLSIHFNIETHDLELVEIGSMDSEAAEPLVESVKKMREVWGDELKTAAFYVRRKNYEYPQVERLIQRRIINTTDNCPVCMQYINVSRRYNCIHRICNDCYNSCLLNNIESCPVCRSG